MGYYVNSGCRFTKNTLNSRALLASIVTRISDNSEMAEASRERFTANLAQPRNQSKL